jgi:hypothetical protein
MGSSLLDSYRSVLLRMPIAHTWRGYGSAIFLEFGLLTPRERRDGSPAAPEGKVGVMIEWSWRIEREATIVCGSSSDDVLCDTTLVALRGSSVARIELFGRLPELAPDLSNGYRILSFMTADGDPKWSLFDRREATPKWLCVRGGEVVEERQPPNTSAG